MNISEDHLFRLFGNCVPVKGARRSIICDLQKNSFDFIPNILYEIITELKDLTIREVKGHYDVSNHHYVDSYFSFLINKGYGFLTLEPELFPRIDLGWESPHEITNAILDIDENSTYDIRAAIKELSLHGCQALQIRSYIEYNDMMREALLETRSSSIRTIEVFLKYDEGASVRANEICKDNPRINYIVIHSSPVNQFVKTKSEVPVLICEQKINSEHSCGEVGSQYFRCNIPMFTESQKKNSCLNRKISIDKSGHICNCPSMKRKYGKIGETTFRKVLDQREFNSLWNISKDQVAVCKHCEFRYICTDCRAYTQHQDDLFSKPSKCHYDPYTAQWNDPSAEISEEKVSQAH